jgi:hypothetical protein
MASSAEYRFMQQQGFKVSDEISTKRHFRSLLFQPTIVGSTLLLAIVFQLASLFLLLGLILWFNSLLPKANPFERLYDKMIGRSKNYPDLPPAPMPRRFMQGMAGTLMLITGFFILIGWTITAYITESFIAIAFILLLFGKFCVGAYIYHLLNGNITFANATCPWSKS